MDRLGMVLSGACIIHCLASPVVAVGAAAAGIRLGEDGVHGGFASSPRPSACSPSSPATAATSGSASWSRQARHALLWAPALAGHGWGNMAEPLLVTADGLLLIRAHRWNRSFCAGCTRCAPASLDLSTRTRCSSRVDARGHRVLDRHSRRHSRDPAPPSIAAARRRGHAWRVGVSTPRPPGAWPRRSTLSRSGWRPLHERGDHIGDCRTGPLLRDGRP